MGGMKRRRWIWRIGIAVVLIGLGWYACAPGPQFKDWPGSAAASSPDGTLTAQLIFRQYRPPSFSTTYEPGDGFRTYLRVNAQEYAPRWTFVGTARYGETPCSLTWESASKLRIDQAGTPAGYGFVLGTCVRMVARRDLHVVQDAVSPVPDALRARLLALGRPEPEIAALRCVRLDSKFDGAVVSERGEVLLILGSKFFSHDPVISRGPVLVENEGNPREVGTSSWVFFDGRSGCMGRVDATDIYLARNAHVWEKECGRPPVRVP
jgi:hypothetical protein